MSKVTDFKIGKFYKLVCIIDNFEFDVALFKCIDKDKLSLHLHSVVIDVSIAKHKFDFIEVKEEELESLKNNV